ncbi:capsular polysaccharide synthesis protein [Endozoicomonas sp. G2_1]|uniref:capsular polysaccharide synthesis protein n=1 Tax=Endozoicomonas sp. G2_1 TaxID=2821091 RepID=UPI001ADB7BFD|nr:capsular polysaccharide synthesis protein [Endozoicomonas sp. G2_1]MBO9490488.1 capsular polysaccharide synthesis protein [Endozoicomonas sp. G2_1]
MLNRLKGILDEFYQNQRAINIMYAIHVLKNNLVMKAKGFEGSRDIYKKTTYALVKKLNSKEIRKFKSKVNSNSTPYKDQKVPIWVCWWQGEENMPEVVKLCFESLKKNTPDIAQINLITLENYKKYIDIPDHILQKFKDNKISYTFLSDVLRFQLLHQHGGLWIDSTVYVASPIEKSVLKSEYFTHRRVGHSNSISEANYSSFLVGGYKGHNIFAFMNEVFSEHLKKYDKIPDYWYVDYAMRMAFDDIPALSKAIRAVPYNNPNIWLLNEQLNQPFDDKLTKKLFTTTSFFKLTYKRELKTHTEDGKLTTYGHLIHKHLSPNTP